jgi:hypothetical protein
MGATAKRTDPALWDRVKASVTRGTKGGRPGQWSARKAQMAVQKYKKRGGGYAGGKQGDNHLVQWTREDWGTKSGRTSRRTGERYLPRKAREELSDAEYRRTTRKKQADTAKGRQFSRQPKDIARKVAPTRASPRGRLADLSRAELMERARRRNVAGRSRMRKAELLQALSRR